LLAILCAMPLGAQLRDVPPNPEPPNAAALHDLARGSAPQESQQDSKERAAAEKRARELFQRLADFAEAWNTLIKMSDKGVWNAKQAKRAHKAFERLVECQGWIETSK
jgi:hypothetical protein